MKYTFTTNHGNVLFDLRRENIIVKMSGGYDSSVALYALAHSIHELGLQDTHQLRPTTVQKIGNETGSDLNNKGDAVPVVQAVVDYTQKAFPDVKINPIRVEKCDNWFVDDRFYRDAQDEAGKQLPVETSLDSVQFTAVNGVTKNPPYSIGLDHWVDPDDPAVGHRHQNATYGDVHPDTASVYMDNPIGPDMQEPWRNADKRIVFSIADQLGIMDDMMKISWSCEGRAEDTNNFTKECMNCWWCLERHWAHKEVKK